jgi:hypothetical protein
VPAITSEIDALVPEVERCDAKNALGTVSALRTAIQHLEDGSIKAARVSLGVAALKIKDHSKG